MCAAVYFAGTPLSGWITAAGLPIWLATGIALTALRLLGLGYWPAVPAAGWLAGISLGNPPGVAVTFAAIGALEALAGLAILQFGRRILKSHPALTWVVLVAIVVPAVGATLIAGTDWTAWKSWWIKDSTGLLLLAPWWTLCSSESVVPPPDQDSVGDSLGNLHKALAAVETSESVMATANEETTAHRPR